MATMKAIQWSKSKSKVEITQLPKPTKPDLGKVIVKVAYSGICGTDLLIIQKEFAAAEQVILGHEFSGIISEIGDDVKNVKIGDRVAIDPYNYCGSCRFCCRGQVSYCAAGGLRSMVGMFRNGGWAEYVEVSAAKAFLLPAGLSLQQGVLCEPYSCILRGWDNNGLVPDDDAVLIMGAGIIGLLWTCLFHHHGYRNVTIVEPLAERRNMVDQLGVGYKVCHLDDVLKEFQDVLAEELGFDLIVDCSGNPKAIQDAFPLLRRGGKLNVCGCCPKKSKMEVNPAEFMLREVSIFGTLNDPLKFQQTCQLVFNMADRYLDYERLTVQIFSMEQYQEAFEALKAGKISKAVFKISDD